ncbi:MAG: FAD-binding oxidoreductase [Candidatus Velthaea sp.]
MIASNPFALATRLPARVEEPADPQRVAALLATAAEAGNGVVAFGGSTLQSLGNAPRRYDVAICLRRLDRVLAYGPRDLTIGLEAGITLESVAGTLAQARQFLPFDAPLPRRATVGGTLAAGWAGPRRATYGQLRDLLIGSTVALTDGSLASAGGMVVKNVTGYDMSKLYVGSLGTLGIIVRANFKTLPQPPAQRLAIAPLGEEVRQRALAALGQLTIEPTAALVVDGFFERTPRVHEEDTRLVTIFEGSEAAVDRATRDLRSVLGKSGVAETLLFDGGAAAAVLQDTIDAYIEPIEDRSITYRSAGLPSTVWQRAHSARAIALSFEARYDFIADVRNGDAIVRLAGSSARHTTELLSEIDAQLRTALPGITVLAGDPRLRAQVDAWGPAPATLTMLRAIKDRFDPSATLAPGRFVGGI